jgi:hypothetical protein
MWEMRNAKKISVGQPEGKRSFWRPRTIFEGNIKINLNEIGCKDVE